MENPRPVGHDTEVAVAVKKSSVSQAALKWTIDTLLTEGHTVTLVHVRPRVPIFSKKIESYGTYHINAYACTDVRKAIDDGYRDILDMRAREMLQPFQSYCRRKNVQSEIVVLEDDNVVTALADFVLVKNIDVLVMGTGSRRSGVVKKLMGSAVTSNVSKKIPYFCTLYAVAKGKLQFVKYASSISQNVPENDEDLAENMDSATSLACCESSVNSTTRLLQSDTGKEFEFRSPLKDYGQSDVSSGGFTSSDSEISFVNSDSRVSDGSSYGWSTYSSGWSSNSSTSHASSSTNNSDWANWSSGPGSSHTFLPEYPGMDEIHRLRLELINSKNKYTSCNETDDELILTSKLNMMNINEEQQMKRVEKPQKSLSRVEGRRIVPTTTDNNQTVGKDKLLKIEGRQGCRIYSTGEIEAATNSFSPSKMIGQGRHGRVYAGHLDHMPVAVKVFEARVAKKEKLLFVKEVEKLTGIIHPNLVCLLGACPENSSLVYEYMRNGNLEDQLYCRGDSPGLSWQRRFCIAAEIGAALLFLHRAKPEPLVHQCLTSRNVLLDYNSVAKLSDFGLVKLIDPSAAVLVSQNSLIQPKAASFIDPEYTQTGVLEPLSDVYSLGVIMLQMLTAKSPVGLAHKVRTAISTGTFSKILDPAVSNWPTDEALSFAKLALQCTEMSRSNRPDLALEILPELNQLRKIAIATML